MTSNKRDALYIPAEQIQPGDVLLAEGTNTYGPAGASVVQSNDDGAVTFEPDEYGLGTLPHTFISGTLVIVFRESGESE